MRTFFPFVLTLTLAACGSSSTASPCNTDSGVLLEAGNNAHSPADATKAADVTKTGVGFSLHYSHPAVPPGAERVWCLDVPSPVSGEVKISGWKVTRAFAHHVNLYVRKTAANYSVPAPCAIGPANEQLLFDETAPSINFQFPAGTAIRVASNARYLFEVHELNTTDASVTTDATVDVMTTTASTQDIEALLLFFPTIVVPAGMTKTLSGSCSAPSALRLLGLTSHSHAHDVQVTASVGGTPIYSSTTWAEPSITYYDRDVAAGTPFNWTCAIQNTLPTVIQNCVSRDTCEMCELLGWAVMANQWTCQR